MGHWRKQMISFFVTSNCNLACTYCYIPKLGEKIARQDRVIDLNFAIAGMRDYFAWSSVPHIRYFSAGEATTAFDTMVAIRQEAHKQVGQALKVELQTNGYFSSRIADWIEENVDILWISSDGPAEIHDTYRPTLGGKPSSPLVLQNIQRFTRHPSMQFGVRVTFMPENFDRQIEVLEFFHERGVRYVCGAPAYSSLPNHSIHSPTLIDFVKHFVPAFFKAQEMGMFYQTHLMVNFDEKVERYCRACTQPPNPQLTSDGYVSCCDWASFGPHYYPGPIQQCVYGQWDQVAQRIVYFPEKQQRIENRDIAHLRQGDCQGCNLLEHCAGGCIGKILSRSGDLYRMNQDWCNAVRYLAQYLSLNQDRFPVHHS